jgi:excisionase family DNA binding protein
VLMSEPWLTVAQIAKELQTTDRAVRAWLRTGRLKGANLGGHTGWRVRRSDLEAFLDVTAVGSGNPKTITRRDKNRILGRLLGRLGCGDGCGANDQTTT